MATLTEACRLSKGVTLIGSECVVKSFLDRINNAEEALCDIRKKIRAASSDLNRFCTFPTTVPIPISPSPTSETCVLDQPLNILPEITYIVSTNDLDSEAYEILELCEAEVCATLRQIKSFQASLADPCAEVPNPDPDPDPDPNPRCPPVIPMFVTMTTDCQWYPDPVILYYKGIDTPTHYASCRYESNDKMLYLSRYFNGWLIYRNNNPAGGLIPNIGWLKWNNNLPSNDPRGAYLTDVYNNSEYDICSGVSITIS